MSPNFPPTTRSSSLQHLLEEARASAPPMEAERRQLLVLGAARRLLDFTSAALLHVRQAPRLHLVLGEEALRRWVPGSFALVPALNALQVHLDLLACAGPLPVRLVDGFPEARAARVAHRWMQGALPGLPADATHLDSLLASDLVPLQRLGPGQVPLPQALQPSSRAALTAGCRLARHAEAAVVVFVQEAALLHVPDAALPVRSPQDPCPPGRLVAVVPRFGPAPQQDPLVHAGYAVEAVTEGLQFEARLHAALERALHHEPDRHGRPPVVALHLSPYLGQPAAVRQACTATAVGHWLRSYHAEKLFASDGTLQADLLALCPPPGKRLEDALRG